MVSTKRRPSDSGADQPSSSRLKLDMSLETVPNILDDATHTLMDNLVVEHFEDEPLVQLSSVVISTLLAIIVSTSEGQLNPDYKDSRNTKPLLRDHPPMSDLLKKAWDNKKFKEIRNLSASITHTPCLQS
jgi:hypothetical protein